MAPDFQQADPPIWASAHLLYPSRLSIASLSGFFRNAIFAGKSAHRRRKKICLRPAKFADRKER
jgi:hypothetical protein